ncbi:gastrula zinc finger protein XlCGF57.1-like [Helicoverpa zea]|uniref:gastrula zinc finger protein XlCGF57.1-like n=1 Tax=Helicoverpa zea TaxID=7113 RepID=UPI001F58E14A|nr:gastrula zinc finger protein XlCGF57.1-like [Helicoverpa zea]
MEYATIEAAMHNLCRICLQRIDQNQNVVNLFNETDESKEIMDKLYHCFQVTLSVDKAMPSLMCGDCINELNSANNLRLKCMNLNERLQILYNDYLQNSTKAENDVLSYVENTDSNSPIDYLETTDLSKQASDKVEIHESEVKNVSDSFTCNLCNKVLKTKVTLLKHYVSMHEKRKHVGQVSGFGAARRYHCTSCSYSTPHSQTLVSHMRTHNGERPYTCECGKSFTQSASLAAHRKTHSTSTYFTCSLCGKQFKHAFTMKNHMRVHEIASFSCNICFKSLKSKETLKAHMYRHYKICNYNCEDCGDTFVTSAELHNHRKKHNVEKKMQCHLCGYKTHTKKNLIVHLKRHTGNRTFKCDMCNVGFYTKSNLRRHLRVHTGDKPYSCPTCGQKFSYSPSLNKHMKTIHGVEYKWSDWKETIVKLAEKVDGNLPSSTKELNVNK